MEGGGGRLVTCDNEIQCINHPHKNNNPGGICALCLQEKLGKLLSSSFPSPPTSSSSPPSPSPSSSSFTPPPPPSSSLPLSLKIDHDHYTRSRLPFLVPNKNSKHKKASANQNQFLHNDEDLSPRKRNGFWSFLYPSSKEAKGLGSGGNKSRVKCIAKKTDHVILEDDKCLSSKVSRSRSVGCGSRSFSGDFFERISSGLSDCTLRRVESQREGKPNIPASAANHCIKQRVKCGGIFGGFVITSSSSTTSSSSSSLDDGRPRSWGWAFASPMRAFTTKSSSKRGAAHKNSTPNLSAIPSLLLEADV